MPFDAATQTQADAPTKRRSSVRKPAAVAECRYLNLRSWPHPTTISRQSAERFTFYAPGWRPMAFRSLEAAKAKLEKHPGFVRWEG